MTRPRQKSRKLTSDEMQKLDQEFRVGIEVLRKRERASYKLWAAFFTSPLWLVPVLDVLAHLGGYLVGSPPLESKLERGAAGFLVLYWFFVAYWIGRKITIDEFFNKNTEERMGAAPESWGWLLDRFYPYPSDHQADEPSKPQSTK